LSSAGVLPPPQLAKAKEVHEPLLKNAHSVIVGISQYQDPSAPSLKFPADDAKSIRALLQSQGGTSGSVLTLIDQAATRQAILNRLQYVVSGAQAGDTILFYFSGHAALNRNILFSAEMRIEKPETTGIPVEDLAALLSGSFKVIVIIDAVLSSKRIASIPALDNALVIAASFASESTQFGGGHGELTWNVLRGLNGEADADSDGRVTISEFTDFIARQKLSREGQPTVVRNGLPGDLPLIVRSPSNTKAY
jgi:hypothetical protein